MCTLITVGAIPDPIQQRLKQELIAQIKSSPEREQATIQQFLLSLSYRYPAPTPEELKYALSRWETLAVLADCCLAVAAIILLVFTMPMSLVLCCLGVLFFLHTVLTWLSMDSREIQLGSKRTYWNYARLILATVLFWLSSTNLLQTDLAGVASSLVLAIISVVVLGWIVPANAQRRYHERIEMNREICGTFIDETLPALQQYLRQTPR